jgi:ABC-type multidrug transport system permease subunit
MQELNKEILVYLNSLLNFPIIENISLVFVDLPIFFLPIFLVSFWIYYIFQKKDENKKDLLFIFYSCIIALIINLVIQQFVHLDRPESVLE